MGSGRVGEKPGILLRWGLACGTGSLARGTELVEVRADEPSR